MNIVNINSNSTLAINTKAYVDSSGGSITLTLPEPTADTLVVVIDATRSWEANPITIDLQSGSTSNIQGAASVILSSAGSYFEFYYSLDIDSWIYVFEENLSSDTVNSVAVLGTNMSANIQNNKLNIVSDFDTTGATNGSLIVYDGTNWIDKTLNSSDIGITNTASEIQLSVNKGSLTETNSTVLSITNGTDSMLSNVDIEVQQANTTTSGYLSSTDWNTFNNKGDAIVSGTSILEIISSVLKFTGQAANTFLAGPVSGPDQLPVFRSLDLSDFYSTLFDGVFTNGAIPVYNGLKFAAVSGFTWLSNKLTVPGKLSVEEFQVDETAETMGLAVLGAQGRVIVNTSKVSTNSRIFLSTITGIGNTRNVYIHNINPGVSFTIRSASMNDRSEVAWHIINPA